MLIYQRVPHNMLQKIVNSPFQWFTNVDAVTLSRWTFWSRAFEITTMQRHWALHAALRKRKAVVLPFSLILAFLRSISLMSKCCTHMIKIRLRDCGRTFFFCTDLQKGKTVATSLGEPFFPTTPLKRRRISTSVRSIRYGVVWVWQAPGCAGSAPPKVI